MWDTTVLNEHDRREQKTMSWRPSTCGTHSSMTKLLPMKFTIPRAQKGEPVTYDGGGHGFPRAGEDHQRRPWKQDCA